MEGPTKKLLQEQDFSRLWKAAKSLADVDEDLNKEDAIDLSDDNMEDMTQTIALNQT